jgi:DNA repair ATPase RecN
MASKNENTGRIILVIVGILVLSALGYFATRYFTQNKKIQEEYIPTIENLKTEVVQLEDNIIKLEASIEDQNLDLAEKDKLLAERDRQLEELEIKLNRYKNSANSSKSDIKEMENRLSLLRSKVSTYEEKVAVLEQQLAIQSDTIRSQRAKTQQLAGTISELSQENQEKEERLLKAGALRAADFVVYNVKKNGKEERDAEFRRASLKSLKLCFNVLQNSEAQSGPKEVFLVFENPDGSINSNIAEGYSGKFLYDGTERIYSAKATFNYTLTTQEVCIPYSIAPEEKYQKGMQYLSVYIDGNLSGQSSFVIK